MLYIIYLLFSYLIIIYCFNYYFLGKITWSRGHKIKIFKYTKRRNMNQKEIYLEQTIRDLKERNQALISIVNKYEFFFGELDERIKLNKIAHEHLKEYWND